MSAVAMQKKGQKPKPESGAGAVEKAFADKHAAAKDLDEDVAIAKEIERARGWLDEESAEARNRAAFLNDLGDAVDSLNAGPIASVAADMIDCVRRADVDNDKIDSFFRESRNSKLGQALLRNKGFRSIEILDGLDGTSGAVFLSILDTVDATEQRKIALREALFFKDGSNAAARFFNTLSDEPIVRVVEKLK